MVSVTMLDVKKYKVIQPVMLGFLTPQDQVDVLLDPKDREFWLESDGHTIWGMNSEQRQESITMANAIDIWLEQGKIEEV